VWGSRARRLTPSPSQLFPPFRKPDATVQPNLWEGCILNSFLKGKSCVRVSRNLTGTTRGKTKP
jgi:hypothetical protein